MSGSAKMARHLTSPNLLPFSSAQRLKTMNRLTFVRLDDSEIQFLDTINSSLTMGPTLRQHSSLVSITYTPLCKSAYLWIIPWPFLLLLLWYRRVLIMLILYCLVVHTSISSSIHTAATCQSRNAAFFLFSTHIYWISYATSLAAHRMANPI